MMRRAEYFWIADHPRIKKPRFPGERNIALWVKT